MEIKMCTCPNGHYYNADIYSSCPECGAAGPAGAGGISPTGPASAPMGYGAPGGGYGAPAGYDAPGERSGFAEIDDQDGDLPF